MEHKGKPNEFLCDLSFVTFVCFVAKAVFVTSAPLCIPAPAKGPPQAGPYVSVARLIV